MRIERITSNLNYRNERLTKYPFAKRKKANNLDFSVILADAVRSSCNN